MSCYQEQLKRQDYLWASKMAKIHIELTQDDIIIYKIPKEENAYGVCCKTDYNEIRGEIIQTLINPKKPKDEQKEE